MHAPSFWELLLIFGVALLIFGSKKLPSLGSALGESIKNFKKSMKELDSDQKPSANNDREPAREIRGQTIQIDGRNETADLREKSKSGHES